MPHRTFLCRFLLLCAVFSVTFLNFFTTSTPSSLFRHPQSQSTQQTPLYQPSPHSPLICPNSTLTNDVLIVLRTGATESHTKLPIHFRTTLRCTPNFLLVSDFEEEVDGHRVLNVLGSVSPSVKNEHPDFGLYNEIQKTGGAGSDKSALLSSSSAQQSKHTPPSSLSPSTHHLSGSYKGDYLNTRNAAWALDKWKFLPMLRTALSHSPSSKWFFFVETDTYFSISNLVSYLQHFDPSQPHYIGKHLYIQSIEFAYGGAGFVLSRPALKQMVERYEKEKEEYEDFVGSHWVGDCAVGKLAADVGVKLWKAWPHLQGDGVRTMDPNGTKIGRGSWCFPGVSWHHVDEEEIEELWSYEQEWGRRHDGNVLMRHRDLYVDLVRPRIGARILDWDNLAESRSYNASGAKHASRREKLDALEREAWRSEEDCRELCEGERRCLQFVFEEGEGEEEKICKLGFEFRLGYGRNGVGGWNEKGKGKGKGKGRVISGWMMERVEDLFLELEGGCGVRDWWAPPPSPSPKHQEEGKKKMKEKEKESEKKEDAKEEEEEKEQASKLRRSKES